MYPDALPSDSPCRTHVIVVAFAGRAIPTTRAAADTTAVTTPRRFRVIDFCINDSISKDLCAAVRAENRRVAAITLTLTLRRVAEWQIFIDTAEGTTKRSAVMATADLVYSWGFGD